MVIPVSVGADGNVKSFLTLFIFAHGEDATDELTPSDLVGKIHKLTTAGVTGNLMWECREINALLFNYGRYLAHNRDMHHVDKLTELRKEVLRYAYIDAEFERLQGYQQSFVKKERDSGRFGVTADKSMWLSEPSPVRYNRKYSFTANPWTDNSYRNVLGRHKLTMEADQFGIWLVDASIHIANRLEFLPGIHSKAVSMMAPLGILPTTIRRTPSFAPGHVHTDTTATCTSLFDIVRRVQQLYGHETYVNVIDVCCRFTQWDKDIFKIIRPLISQGLRYASSAISPWSERLAQSAITIARRIDSQRLSPRAESTTDTKMSEYFNRIEHRENKLKRVIYWETNGAMKVVDVDSPTMVPICVGPGPCESVAEYEVFGHTYKVNDTIEFPNGRRFTIFYILPGPPTWFFTHTLTDEPPIEEKTIYFTPNQVTHAFESIGNPVIPPKDTDSLQSHIHNVASFHSQEPSVRDAAPLPHTFIRNFLPPYEYVPTGLFHTKIPRPRKRPRSQGGRRRSIKRSRPVPVHSRKQKRTRRVKTKKMN
jgi:hypothetical protein